MKTIGKRWKKIRNFVLGILRHMPRLRLSVRHWYWKRMGKEYDRLANATEVNSKKVFFESFGGRSFSCSPKAIYLTMLQDARFDDFEFVWCFKGNKRVKRFRKKTALRRATVVQRGSEAYFDALASTSVIITNSRFPEYVNPKQSQTYVQCWHGTPLKRLGHDIEIATTNALNTSSELAERYSVEASKWTYLLSPSPYTTKHLGDAFGIPDEKRSSLILELGYPRNDSLARAVGDDAARTMRELRFRLGIPSYKKVMLYAPTWRDNSYKTGVGYTFDYLIDFDELRETLGDEWVVLFRPHYFIANSFDFGAYKGFIYNVAKTSDINELYLMSDLLITDYSSVMFDFAILKRPMMLFVPDKEFYDQDVRGFYFDLDKVPGPQSTTTEQLIADISSLDTYWDRYGESYRSFVETFCPIDDGHAAERVLDRLFPPNDDGSKTNS